MPSSKLRIGVVMDPVESITPKKDSSLAMLLEAERRAAEIHYMLQDDLRLVAGQAMATSDAGALIVNKPQALRDMNEKAFTAWFPQCAPLTLITRSMPEMKVFLAEHGRIVVKPLDGMGGKSIFVVSRDDKNANVIFETLTDNGTRFAMAQVFIPEISEGDKRILLIDGEPVPYSLARIPSADDNRGNLVMGAVGEGRELTERERWICGEVGPVLRENGVIFCGIDVIGDYLTEINVTSPTGIRELDRIYDLNIAGQLFDAIEARLG